MLRVLLLDILLLSLPFILYAAYIVLAKGDDPSAWDNIPFVWLLGIGVALLLIGMVTLVSFESGDPDAKYTPPVYQDGTIKPGHLD